MGAPKEKPYRKSILALEKEWACYIKYQVQKWNKEFLERLYLGYTTWG